MEDGFGPADTKISVIMAIEIQLQIESAGRGSVVQIEADVLFCNSYVKESTISLSVS